MRLYRLDAVQSLKVSIDQAWAFFCNPRNLAVITPPWLGIKVTSDLPETMFPGLIITYTVRPVLGIPVTWVTEITHVVEPWMFVDEQRFGPYRFWHHRHGFVEIEGGVECRDTVHYALWPLPFASVVNRLMVRKNLDSIFAYRRRVLEERFDAP